MPSQGNTVNSNTSDFGYLKVIIMILVSGNILQSMSSNERILLPSSGPWLLLFLTPLILYNKASSYVLLPIRYLGSPLTQYPFLINNKRSLECILSSSASWCLSNALVLQEVVFL